jgi:hypothetical protein
LECWKDDLMKVTEAHVALSQATFGDAEERYDRYSPSLNADGAIALAPEDGQVLDPVPAKCIQQRVSTLENTGDLASMIRSSIRYKTILRLFGFQICVTQARIIFRQVKPEGPDGAVVGHVRFPWISSVSFRPKQSFFLSDSTLQVEFSQSFPVAALGSWHHVIEVTFDKTYHPGSLAHHIACRAARHNLTHGGPDEAKDALHRVAEGSALADPPKGEFAAYHLPTFTDFPWGAAYIGDDAPATEWHVTNEAAT